MFNKKILITGACGFIGSHLVELFIEKGYEVVAFDRYNSNNDFGWLNKSKYKKEINFVLGDIRDYDSVYNTMKACNHCIHLAALIGIPYSYISPLAYIKTNIEGTYNILESVKNLDIEQVLITSTSETYGSSQYTPMDEKHPLVAQSPYSASKISADQLALSYYLSFDLPIKIVRPFNVYGPRQSSRALIPTIITQFLAKKDFLSLGNIETKRDFTFVLDVCDAFFYILKSPKLIGEVTNIGMNNNISVKELINLISIKLNCNKKIKIDSERIRPQNSEVDNLLCDNNKILKNTAWKPKFKLSTGLDITIEWIIKNKENFDPEIYHV